MAAIHLTTREREILLALTHKVRFLSLAQVARTFFPAAKHPPAAARRGLRRLLDADLLARERANIHPELALIEPAACWQPGDQTPPLGPLAYQLARRWTEPNQPTTYFFATPRAARLMGGQGGAPKRHYQLNHDLHVATVYLRFRERDPEVALRWVSEDLLPPPDSGAKHPDAMIRDATGNPVLVVEFGGAYDVPSLEKLHTHCAVQKLPYELW